MLFSCPRIGRIGKNFHALDRKTMYLNLASTFPRVSPPLPRREFPPNVVRGRSRALSSICRFGIATTKTLPTRLRWETHISITAYEKRASVLLRTRNAHQYYCVLETPSVLLRTRNAHQYCCVRKMHISIIVYEKRTSVLLRTIKYCVRKMHISVTAYEKRTSVLLRTIKYCVR